MLSICIYVYNQMELLRANVAEIVKYKGNDIEIVVGDNCSTEPIEDMLHEFHDPRITYCRSDKHRGIDYSILNALRNCSGEYVFLFRTKDVVLPEKIDDVIRVIKSHPRASYFGFSAKDENYKTRKIMKNQVYPMGKKSQEAYFIIMDHPSGHIYKRSCLRFDLYQEYIDRISRGGEWSSIVHQLILMDLAVQGDFVTVSIPAYRLAHTLWDKNPAVYTTGTKVSLYAPCYQYPTYKCQMHFADRELSLESRDVFLPRLISRSLYRIVPFFMIRNSDMREHRHYHTEPIPFFPYKELVRFTKYSLSLIKSLKYDKKAELCLNLLKIVRETAFIVIPAEKKKIKAGIYYKE